MGPRQDHPLGSQVSLWHNLWHNMRSTGRGETLLDLEIVTARGRYKLSGQLERAGMVYDKGCACRKLLCRAIPSTAITIYLSISAIV